MKISKRPLKEVFVWVGHVGESIWAKHVEGDLFAIDTLPQYAYGLNYGDIVRVRGDEIRTVVRRSGHQTLRVYFDARVNAAKQGKHMAAIEALGGSYERMSQSLVVVDVPPSASHAAIIASLDLLEASTNDLVFETCEARRRDAFDDGQCPMCDESVLHDLHRHLTGTASRRGRIRRPAS